jgi:hypothetical protein
MALNSVLRYVHGQVTDPAGLMPVTTMTDATLWPPYEPVNHGFSRALDSPSPTAPGKAPASRPAAGRPSPAAISKRVTRSSMPPDAIPLKRRRKRG